METAFGEKLSEGIGKHNNKDYRTKWLLLALSDSGHTIAIVLYGIEFTKDAHRDFKGLDAPIRAMVRAALEAHLRHEPTKPTKVSKSRIKRLRELRQPQYRLRIAEVRVYYDVEDETVTVLGVVQKAASYDWLAAYSIKEND